MTFSTLSVGSDDSGSSDLTSYYCIDYDTRYDLGPGATPYVCEPNRPSNNNDIGDIHTITRVPAAEMARYLIFAIDPVTG